MFSRSISKLNIFNSNFIGKYDQLKIINDFNRQIVQRNSPTLSKCSFGLLTNQHTARHNNVLQYVNIRNFSSDIPEYLKEIANIVPELQEHIIEEIDDLENNIEDDIIESLLARAISYEELEGSFMVGCPTCSVENKSFEAFVHKNSGYTVCPWCYWDGTWDEFLKILDEEENSLSQEQLDDYFMNLKPFQESHGHLLKYSSLKNVDVKIIKAVGGLISDDETRVVFPLVGELNTHLGFVSISLTSEHYKVIKRALKGRCAALFCPPLPKIKKKMKRLVVVTDVFAALHLAKFRIPTVVLTQGNSSESLKWIADSFKAIFFWSDIGSSPPKLLHQLSNEDVECFVVKVTRDVPEITAMNEHQIQKLLSEALQSQSNSIVSFHDLESQVYHRVVNKDVMFGVKWSRFAELNDLLMGHREGELTVFSGQTGSGKTTFVSEYSLDLCMKGVRTLWGSFEVNVTRLCEVMLQQYFGNPLPENYSEFRNIGTGFAQMPLHFLNLHGQQPLQHIIDIMTEAVVVNGVRHVVIDNLQFMLGIHGASADWWLGQDRAVGAFRQFATAFNCHVTLIVHPRKMLPGEKLNLHSISGGARVTQEADNVIILHTKENKDGSTNSSAPKTLQVVKNRYGGTLGEVKLRFHKPSLTLSGCFLEHKGTPRADNEDEKTDANQRNQCDIKGLPFMNSN